MVFKKWGKQDIDTDIGESKHDYVKYSMTRLLEQCKDFKEQKTDLEQRVDKTSSNHIYNITIIFTPTFQCELAGEVIEYSWGASKYNYLK